MSEAARPQGNLPHTFRCRNHPEREAVGICVGCRAVVCVECSTKVEGMNYCIACLRSAVEPPPDAAPANPRSAAYAGVPLLILSFAATALVFMVLGFFLAWARTWAQGSRG